MKKTTTKNAKRLTVSKETLRAIRDERLSAAAGGGLPPRISQNTCNVNLC